MERDCESELSKLNIEQNACIYHFGASVIHGQRSNILRLRFDLHYREKIRIIKLPAIVVDITNLQHSSWEIRNDAEEIVLSELAYI